VSSNATQFGGGDSTRRFSSRVADYVRYRPGYPTAIVDELRRLGSLWPGAVVADVGSGTGLLTRVFLEAGYQVYGVEPNAEMRVAGEEQLRGAAGFVSVNGTAEATTLPDQSVDLVTAGQAFHWFDRAKAKAEARRILRGRPGGWVALIWNERRVGATPFLAAYEQLLRHYATDYQKVDHRQITAEVLEEFFAPNSLVSRKFENRQVFDFAGVRGRLLSSSYAPPVGHPQHEPMMRELARIFQEHQNMGQVVFEYDTALYAGRLS
jgi:SAM-dependent methyltransferase